MQFEIPIPKVKSDMIIEAGLRCYDSGLLAICYEQTLVYRHQHVARHVKRILKCWLSYTACMANSAVKETGSTHPDV